MHETRYFDEGLCFPAPPARIDRSWRERPLLPAVAAEYLAEIFRWRERLLAGLPGDDPLPVAEPLTRRARAHFTLLLGNDWDADTHSWAADSPYNLAPFPAGSPPGNPNDTMATVMDVLRWRAAVADYLSDVWDVLGAPPLEREECAALALFVQPARMEGRCVFCLTEYEPERRAPEDHGCVMLSHVRAKAPPRASDPDHPE